MPIDLNDLYRSITKEWRHDERIGLSGYMKGNDPNTETKE